MTLKRKRAGTVVAAGALLIVPVVSSGASAVGSDDSNDALTAQFDAEAAPVVETEDEALRRDLELVAQARGWTVEQAAAQHMAAEAVGEVAVRIGAERPDVLVGSALSSEPGGTPSLYIKGEAGAFVKNAVAEATVDVAVVDGQPYSFNELNERAGIVHSSLRDMGFEHVVTGVDIDGAGRIPVEVTAKPGISARASEIVDRLPAQLRASVDLTVSQSAVTRDEHAYGGMRMRDSNSNCTSGWSVRHDSGTTGVATAGHCSVGDGEIVEPGVGVWDLDHQEQHIGTWGDVEWKTTSHVEPPIFYADTSVTRNVKAVAQWMSISEGESVCLYGRSSNDRTCAPEVVQVGLYCNSASSLVQTTPDVGIPGDSGGGWSYGTTAYGLHKGNCGSNREVFSLAQTLNNALDVQVRLS